MSSQTQRSTMVLPARGDAIRIVPLHLPDELTAPCPAPPQFTYRGGPLLSAVEVFTVFWGRAWRQPPQSDLADNLNQFFQLILTSPLLDQLSEYSVPGGPQIGYGEYTGTATITTPRLRHSVSDHAIQHMLEYEISTNDPFPQPGPNTLYFVYLPEGVPLVH